MTCRPRRRHAAGATMTRAGRLGGAHGGTAGGSADRRGRRVRRRGVPRGPRVWRLRHASRPGHVLQLRQSPTRSRSSRSRWSRAAVAWFAVEYLQTRRLASLEGQVHHPHVRAHADRDRHERRARGHDRVRPEDPDLPRLGRHDPGGCPVRTVRRGRHRRGRQHPLDVRHPTAVPVSAAAAFAIVAAADRDHRRAGRTRRPAPAASEHANSPARGGGVVVG